MNFAVLGGLKGEKSKTHFIRLEQIKQAEEQLCLVWHVQIRFSLLTEGKNESLWAQRTEEHKDYMRLEM